MQASESDDVGGRTYVRVMELLDRAAPLPLASRHAGVVILALHGRLSRVTRRDGTVLGYVERLDPHDGEAFLAKRLRPRAQGFVEVGRFGNADDAVEALR
jgi:hypothetical protein